MRGAVKDITHQDIELSDTHSGLSFRPGTYQYYEFEWVDYWIPVADHPDGGVWYPVEEIREYQAPMTARLVDVDGKSISVDPYYNGDTGRVELRIAGFQPVID